MRQTTVNVRELKNRLSHYLRLTKAGQSVEITERGTPIGRIVPTTVSIENRIDAMAQAGLVLWNKHKPKPMAPVTKSRGKRTISDLVSEDRE